jgi:hypothetical protein
MRIARPVVETLLVCIVILLPDLATKKGPAEGADGGTCAMRHKMATRGSSSAEPEQDRIGLDDFASIDVFGGDA